MSSNRFEKESWERGLILSASRFNSVTSPPNIPIRCSAKISVLEFGLTQAFKETRKAILEEIANVKKELKDESIGVFARGKEVDFEKYDGVKPCIENNRTLVPIRAITEALDAEVEWVNETRQVIITKSENEIILTIGSTKVLVKGKIPEASVWKKE